MAQKIKYRMGRFPAGSSKIDWGQWFVAVSGITAPGGFELVCTDANRVEIMVVDAVCDEVSPFEIFDRAVKCERGAHEGDKHYYMLPIDDECASDVKIEWST